MTGDDRGTSALIGIILLFGLVVVGSVGVLLIGGQVNEESKQRAETTRIEQSFLELGATFNDLARSEGDVRTVDLDLPGDSDGAVRESASGRIWVNRTNFSAADTDTLVNESIGSIRYDGDQAVAYQAGAVFRGTGNETVVLSNPGFQYSISKSGGKPTLSLPIVTTVGPDSIPNGDVRAEKIVSKTPVNNETVVENDLVSVTVQSEYYVGWAAYFRELAAETDTEDTAVTVDHQNQTATIELIVPATRRSIKGGIVSGSNAGTVTIANSIKIQSYNSSDCPFDPTTPGCATDKGDVIVAGNLTFENKGHVLGNVTAGDTLRIDNGANLDTCPSKPDKYIVCGYASYGNQFINDKGGKTKSELIGGGYDQNASVSGYDPVNVIIDAKINQFKDDNDNGVNGVITSSDRIDCSSDPCTVSAGTYFLDEIESGDFNGNELVLDTTSGPVNVVVDGEVDLSQVTVSVRGGNRANLFIDSTKGPGACDKNSQSACDLEFDRSTLQVKDATGTVTDNAARMWVYMDSNADATFIGGGGATTSSPEFTGVVFGPGEGTSTGVNISAFNKAKIQGALVGNVYAAAQNGALRYDRRLRNTETIISSTRVPRLTYLVASTYVLEVEDG